MQYQNTTIYKENKDEPWVIYGHDFLHGYEPLIEEIEI